MQSSGHNDKRASGSHFVVWSSKLGSNFRDYSLSNKIKITVITAVAATAVPMLALAVSSNSTPGSLSTPFANADQNTSNNESLPAQASANSSNNSSVQTHVKVNGQTISLPANGSVHKTIISDNGHSVVNISVDNSSSTLNGGSGSSSSHVEVHQSSTSSVSNGDNP